MVDNERRKPVWEKEPRKFEDKWDAQLRERRNILNDSSTKANRNSSEILKKFFDDKKKQQDEGGFQPGE